MPVEIGKLGAIRQWKANEKEADYWNRLNLAEKGVLLQEKDGRCFLCLLDEKMNSRNKKVARKGVP